MSSASSRLFILLQHVLPKHLFTAFVHWLAQIKVVAVKNFLIRNFLRLYDVNVDEIETQVPDGFATFNDFFTRALTDGVRPVDRDPGSIVSPVDGTVSAAGPIEHGQVFQAKGFRYTLDDLLSADLQDAERYRHGQFATIYLAPYDYHRVHAPLAGELRVARYIPGDLYSVNETTVQHLPGLFARNERLVCHFESDNGPFVLVFVGALNVGSITTPWTGEIRPKKRGIFTDFDPRKSGTDPNVEKGGLLGWFNMGSTVIVLLPDGSSTWSATLAPGNTLEMGQVIGRITQPQNA